MKKKGIQNLSQDGAFSRGALKHRKGDDLIINGKHYNACCLKMVEIYGGKDLEWKGWYNLILDLGGHEFDKSIAGPIDPATSQELKVAISCLHQ